MIPARVLSLPPLPIKALADANRREDRSPLQAGDDDLRHPSSHGQQMQAGCDARTARDYGDQRRRQAAMATNDERV
ncbi:hypothetical protein [Ancylobacter terrae]|uniref:hypothetical protein n=1 Tax=Ancylobacter sp. sgz301288 TaxID=3342077 RepID=UPI00385DB797